MIPEELIGFWLYRRLQGHGVLINEIDGFLSGPTGLENEWETEDWFQCIVQLAYIRFVYGIYHTFDV